MTRSVFKRFWIAVNQIENHFRSVIDMSRSTRTLKGIQVPGSIAFKKLPKRAWMIASSLFKMAVKFCYEKYTGGGENSSRTVRFRCERLWKPCIQSWAIFGKFKHLQMEKPQDVQLEESQILWALKALHVVFMWSCHSIWGSRFHSLASWRNFKKKSQWFAWN